ncbi:hypothetical protein BU15DRAFT_56107 [Melanogaster broomeanus]|nr:hypothetical protein BU15DRAFT_56107 [Melanogaster broomeanus]
MLRRPPTMIPMSDADVQDIRELVAHQKSQYDQKQKTLLHMKKIAERPFAEDDPAAMAFLKQMSDRAREREERNKRLGITPGQSSSCMFFFLHAFLSLLSVFLSFCLPSFSKFLTMFRPDWNL